MIVTIDIYTQPLCVMCVEFVCVCLYMFYMWVHVFYAQMDSYGTRPGPGPLAMTMVGLFLLHSMYPRQSNTSYYLYVCDSVLRPIQNDAHQQAVKLGRDWPGNLQIRSNGVPACPSIISRFCVSWVGCSSAPPAPRHTRA